MKFPKKIRLEITGNIDVVLLDDDDGTGQISIEPGEIDVVVRQETIQQNFELDLLGPRYRVNPEVPAPREGSVNSAVWHLVSRLPETFTRAQFESTVPLAMRYDSQTQKFGVPTNFPGIKRARQAYFAEFKKRRWIIPVSQS